MEPRPLYRAREERWIAGVCAGLARFFKVDATAIRVGFIALSFWNGVGVLLYLILLLVVPEEPVGHMVTEPLLPQEHAADDPRGRGVRTLGVILLLGGIYLLLRNLDLLTQSGERLVSLTLILAGLIILMLRPGRI